MELPNLGKHCENPECKQLDFLPYTCKCGQIYCSDHYPIHTENCPNFKKQQSNSEESKVKSTSCLYKCSHPDCKETSLVPLICEKCNKHFCVVHRHVTKCFDEDPKAKEKAIAKLQAPIVKFNEAKALVDKQVNLNIAEAKKKPKNTKMATQLQLMKIKNKATGLKSVPISDRIYFNVDLSPISNGQMTTKREYPVFVSQTWSLGRTIDAIAVECKIPSATNKGHKLRLFKSETEQLLHENLAETMKNLMENSVIVNGDNLFLKLVED